jgi:hypothetical protein
MTIRHRGNALFVVIDGITIDVETLDGNISHPPALPANITLCDEQANAVMEFVIPEHPASQQHWLIPEAVYSCRKLPCLVPVCPAACLRNTINQETAQGENRDAHAVRRLMTVRMALNL